MSSAAYGGDPVVCDELMDGDDPMGCPDPMGCGVSTGDGDLPGGCDTRAIPWAANPRVLLGRCDAVWRPGPSWAAVWDSAGLTQVQGRGATLVVAFI